MSHIVDANLLEQLRQTGGQNLSKPLFEALIWVAATSDYNVSYPGAPLGRAEAIDALLGLQHHLSGGGA